jgi:hypothetical protein
LSVHKGVFQTAAPFSFQAGEKVLFSGAHLPHPIVLGDVYTVSSIAPLSFKISELKCDDLNAEHKAGIFQVRVWSGDTHPSIINAAAQSSDRMFATPSKDANNRAASARTRPSIQAHAVGLASTASHTLSIHASSIHGGSVDGATKFIARRNTGMRRTSNFVTNIVPLQRNDAHESARSKFCTAELPPRYRDDSTPIHIMSVLNFHLCHTIPVCGKNHPRSWHLQHVSRGSGRTSIIQVLLATTGWKGPMLRSITKMCSAEWRYHQVLVWSLIHDCSMDTVRMFHVSQLGKIYKHFAHS